MAVTTKSLRIAIEQEGTFSLAVKNRFTLPSISKAGVELTLRLTANGHVDPNPDLMWTVASRSGLAGQLATRLLYEAARSSKPMNGRLSINLPIFAEAIIDDGDTVASAINGLADIYPGFNIVISLSRINTNEFKRLEWLIDLVREAGAAITLGIDATNAGLLSSYSSKLNGVCALKLHEELIQTGGGFYHCAMSLARIIQLSHQHGWSVIASGINTERAAATAMLSGCNEGEGIYLGSPAAKPYSSQSTNALWNPTCEPLIAY